MSNSNSSATISRPHVVLLGAGASCATIPNGDKYGKKISAMDGFLQKSGIDVLLKGYDISTKSKNLEDIYVEIDEKSKNDKDFVKLKNNIENSIQTYMESFQLPDQATIYDLLILSLTKKDLIATFNWDPMIIQAVRRVLKFTQNTPKIVFLHGNVSAGYCPNCNLTGNKNAICKCCHHRLQDFPLLYPVKDKNYSSSLAIKASWYEVQRCLEKAYIFTIFGYSAPKTDVEAVSLMKNAWSSIREKKLEEIEIIDIKSENDVVNSWSDFIFQDHYTYCRSFFESSLAQYPRRTCETMWAQIMESRFVNGATGFNDSIKSLDQAYGIIKSLDTEENNGTSRSIPYLQEL